MNRNQILFENAVNNAKKRVRFASLDSNRLSKSETINTNTYQLGELCKVCGSIRIGNTVESGCKNCLIPKPSKNSLARSKSAFLSESMESLKNLDKDTIRIENPNKIPHYLESLKKIEIENDDPFDSNSNLIFKSKNNPLPTKPRRLSNSNIPTKNLNDSSKTWSCFSCKEILVPGEVAICAEHISPEARWHTTCFTCNVCKKLLVDLLYYNKGNEILCEKHYKEYDNAPKLDIKQYKEEKQRRKSSTDSKRSISPMLTDEFVILRKYEDPEREPIVCAGCDLPIDTNQYISAENRNWHMDHFICWNCESSLGGQKYLVVNSKPYCMECHTVTFGKTCITCKFKIPPEVVRLTYENLDWHATEHCFKCAACNKNLLETHFLLKNNLLFCSMDCKRKIIPQKQKKF